MIDTTLLAFNRERRNNLLLHFHQVIHSKDAFCLTIGFGNWGNDHGNSNKPALMGRDLDIVCSSPRALKRTE
jgi:hypothetical protein